MSRPLSGLLGEGAVYRGDLTFDGKVRIDGTLVGKVRCDDVVEIGPCGRVEGDIDAAQLLVAGSVSGRIEARERCTLLETAVVQGRLVTPWLDARVGCRIDAEVVVTRGKS